MKIKSYETLKDEVFKIEVPQDTSSYKAVSHKNLIESILEQADKKNFIVDKEVYRTANNGLQLSGDIRFKSGLDNEVDMSLVVQNSYNKSLSLKISSGAYCIICGNGMVHGSSMNFKKKHVGEIQYLTPLEIVKQLDNMEKEFQKAIDFKEATKRIEITKKTCAELLGRMYIEENIISSTQLSIIKGEMEIPSYDYGVNENSVWSNYNHITHSYKNLHPALTVSKNIQLSDFYIKEFELV